MTSKRPDREQLSAVVVANLETKYEQFILWQRMRREMKERSGHENVTFQWTLAH